MRSVLIVPKRVGGKRAIWSEPPSKRSGARHFHRLFRGSSAFRPGMLAQSGGYSQVPGTLSAPPSTRLNAYQKFSGKLLNRGLDWAGKFAPPEQKAEIA
jgi:hypothetical protein